MNYKAFAKAARMALVAVIMASALTLTLGPVQTAHAETLAYGRSINGQISDYNLHEYHRFEGNGGDLISISLDRTWGDLDPYLTLHFWNGAEWIELVTDDDSGEAGNSLINGYVLPSTGWYSIGAHRYDHQDGATSGSYLLTLTLLSGANACPSNDSDCDGFTNDFESWLIEAFKPVVIYDEDEHECVDVKSETATLYQVTPYATAGRYGKSGALITVVILYPKDCGGFGIDLLKGHPGDAEALRIFVTPNPLNDLWYVDGILMKRHYDKWEAYKPSEFAYSGTHPVIYASWSKHAMFPSWDACEDYSLDGWGIVDFEYCGGGTSLNLYTPLEHNVGERGAPAFDAMRDAPSNVLARLFSTEYTWTEAPFCGGWVGFPCAGALSGKWWPHVDAQERAFQENLIEEAIAP